MTQMQPIAAEQVAEAAEALCRRPDVSAARARQVKWVVSELMLALSHPDFMANRPLRQGIDLLNAPVVACYLGLAERGQLRRRPSRRADGASSPASMRVRETVLMMLGEQLGRPIVLDQRTMKVPPRETVDAVTRSELRAYLNIRAAADAPSWKPGRLRLLAIIGTVLDTGARVGELCAMTVDDLEPGRGGIVLGVHRRPQAGEQALERIALSAGTRSALDHWLVAREQIQAPQAIGARALWVSVLPNHGGRSPVGEPAAIYPAGMPLRPRGLQRAYTRAVVALNMEMAGAPGWTPLPSRLEQLRRAVEPQVLTS